MSMKKMFSGALAIGALLLAVGLPPRPRRRTRPSLKLQPPPLPRRCRSGCAQGCRCRPGRCCTCCPGRRCCRTGAGAQQGRHRLDAGLHRLVILMTMPGLGLFYGGLVRSKNMLSVLMQVFMIFSLISCCGSSTATARVHRGQRLLRRLRPPVPEGPDRDSRRHLQQGRGHSRTVFVAFQGTFAAITWR
jgi:Amt family ammonium transporter